MPKGQVAWNKGMKTPDDTRKKLSLAMLGRPSLRKGKHQTEESNQKNREAHLGGKNPSFGRTGEKHPMFGRCGELSPTWQGGISFLPYPSEFNAALKEQIRERDNHTCQLCGVPQQECIRKLAVHHIDYDKDNLAKENLISLCISCNTMVNYNREYWTRHFQEIKWGPRSS